MPAVPVAGSVPAAAGRPSIRVLPHVQHAGSDDRCDAATRTREQRQRLTRSGPYGNVNAYVALAGPSGPVEPSRATLCPGTRPASSDATAGLYVRAAGTVRATACATSTAARRPPPKSSGISRHPPPGVISDGPGKYRFATLRKTRTAGNTIYDTFPDRQKSKKAVTAHEFPTCDEANVSDPKS
jgi:hypothetical protein